MGIHALLLLAGILTAHSICGATADASVPSNGLGDRINWLTLANGFVKAKEEGKPLMLIIHKSWCGACKSLKPKIAESDEIVGLSAKYIMVNSMDDDEPKASDDRYTPDGGYIPRILFFSPNGDLYRDAINESGNEKFKYYYYDDESVADSMQRVIVRVEVEKRGKAVPPEIDIEDMDRTEL